MVMNDQEKIVELEREKKDLIYSIQMGYEREQKLQRKIEEQKEEIRKWMDHIFRFGVHHDKSNPCGNIAIFLEMSPQLFFSLSEEKRNELYKITIEEGTRKLFMYLIPK